MNVVAFIQARVGSTRLPGKVLMDLEGKPVVLRVIERVKKASNVNEVVVVTTFDPKDLPIVKLCAELGIRVFCGSEDDVLDRFYQAAKLIKPEHIVRITADCPVMDPAIIIRVVQQHIKNHCDYTSNIIEENFPDGEDVEVFSFEALKKAWKEADLMSEREHVTLYIRNHPERFSLSSVKSELNLSNQRWTLDTDKDYAFLTSLYKELGSEDEYFGMNKIIALLKERNELNTINAGIARNEGLQKSLRNDRTVADEGR